MSSKFKKILFVIIVSYLSVIVPIILYNYGLYLKKPNESDWGQVQIYFMTSENYKNEPVVFNPTWLKPYATMIINKFRVIDLNVAKKNDNFDIYWLMSTNKNIPENYQIVMANEFRNLFVFKLKKITSP